MINQYTLKICFIVIFILTIPALLFSQNDTLDMQTETMQDPLIRDARIIPQALSFPLLDSYTSTGAVSHISYEDFNNGLISDPLLLIQGKVAGMQIYNRGGDPNLASLSRIRGLSGFSNQKPLIVIDGIPGASLQNIDPNDIASITVLKDGSTQAIYGIRSSNGVLLINTKKGSFKNDTLTLSYNGQLATSLPYQGVPVMSAEEFRTADGIDFGSATNWLDEVDRTGISNTHALVLKGRHSKTDYRLSGNYRNIAGVLQKSGFDQVNLRAGISREFLAEALSIAVSASYTDRNSSHGFNEAFRYAVSFNPTVPLEAKDVTFSYNTEQYGGYFETAGLFDSYNPKAIVDLNDRIAKLQQLTTSLQATYKIKSGLSLNFRYAYQDLFANERAWYSPQSLFRGNASGALPERKGRADLNDYEDSFSLYELFGEYKLPIGRSMLNLTAGTFYQDGEHSDHFLQLTGLSNEAVIDAKRIGSYPKWENEALYKDTINNGWSDKLSAFYGRANFNVADQFFLNASLRYEGSSKLGENERWGFFPAFGAAVDFSQLKEMPSVDQLKLRVGYGITGGIPLRGGLSKEYIVMVEQEDSTFLPNIIQQANPDLKWEQKNELNIGLDFQFGNVGGYLDWYSREVKDWISQAEFRGPYINQNAVKSRGIELGLDWQLIEKEQFAYYTGLVFSTYHTEYTELANTPRLALDPCCGTLNPVIPLDEGEALGNISAPVFVTVDPNGDPVFEDSNGDGIGLTGIQDVFSPESDIVPVGNGLPDFELGWNHRLNISGWEINAFFRGAFGHSLVNMNRLFYEPRWIYQNNVYNMVNTSLTEEGLRLSRYSSLYVEKANFFKLDNLSVSRSFPFGAGSRKKHLNVSLTSQNLFVITNYTGTDPEPVLEDTGQTSNGNQQYVPGEGNPLAPGVDRRNYYLPSQTIVLGVGLTF